MRRLLLGLLVALVALGGWLMPRHPLLAAVVVAAVVALGVFQWRVQRAARRLTDAGLRCDLDALERSATGPMRILANIALVHHGAGMRSLVSLCTCGECDKDWFDTELEYVARISRAAWSGRGKEAYDLAMRQDPSCKDVPPPFVEAVMPLRLVNLLVSYAAAVDDEASPDERPLEWVDTIVSLAETSWPALRWPVRLAAARDAAARGDHSVVQRRLEQMPAWPDGSPLERVRQRLLAQVSAAARTIER